MSASLSPPRERPAMWLLVFLGVSAALHVGLLVYLDQLEPPAARATNRPVELVMFEVEKPKPPEPEKLPEPEPPKPKPVKPPPVKVARAEKPPAEPPKENLPPPPNDAPPAEAPSKPVPLVVGISMSSTTTAGTFAAPVGNTVYGKTERTAADPAEVKQYSAPKYAPIHTVDSDPGVLAEVKVDYPPEAKRAGVEGTVLLSLLIDDTGKVVRAKIVSGLGYGLDEAAVDAMLRTRFRPASKGGQAVSTEIKYRYTFLLD